MFFLLAFGDLPQHHHRHSFLLSPGGNPANIMYRKQMDEDSSGVIMRKETPN
jgi:hypothetical protein